MKRATGIGIIVTLLLVAGVIPGATAVSTFGSETEQIGGLQTDLVTIQARVTAAGNADFQIQYAIELNGENESQAFGELAADIEANESAYLDRFADRMNATVEAAERATGRPMSIGNVDVWTNRTSLGKEYGLVTYSATWRGFANATGNRLTIGDALEGLFIDQDTRFVLQWPETYQLESVKPSPDESSETEVVWMGPREFDAGGPSVTLVLETTETDPESTTQESAPTLGPTTEKPPTSGGAFPVTLLGIGVIVLLLVGGWYWRRGGFVEQPSSSDGSDLADHPAESQNGEPPAELLSNEERVEQYLESVGGRAKQQEIVEALDWTEAKTSQVLTEMTETGTIEKFRIGRENVVKLTDDETE
ncbi:MAG: helix-turn-helix transcriptional regulator [Halodesulfurarchaeum sp.]